MTDERDLAFTPAWMQADMVASGEVSPVELVELYLRRIERIDPKIGAYITVAAEQALDTARAAEAKLARSRGPFAGQTSPSPSASARGRGGILPPLFGVPISLKDVEATMGIRTTLGSRAFAETVPEHDSVVSERVRASGAVIIGKTNTPEIAIHLDTITDNDVRGPCRNPWDLSRTTGGSSGGAAAALATGLCALAVGSDGGGSIRIPASFCGVFGMKPTQGRVPRAAGLGRADPNQFAQSGPMSNCVLDSALLLQALSGPDPRDQQPYLREPPPDFIGPVREVMAGSDSRPLAGLRVGWSADLGHAAVDPGVARACHEAALVFESLGAELTDGGIKLNADLPNHFWNVFGANAYLQFGHLLEDPRTGPLIGKSARTALERGKTISGHAYARSLRVVNELRLYVDRLFENYDLILTPTTAIPAFDPTDRPTRIAGREIHAINGFYPYTFPFNMSQHPAASVPCGFVDGAGGRATPTIPSPSTGERVPALAGVGAGRVIPSPSQGEGQGVGHKLPAGLQVVGRRGDDAGVLRACAAFEMARPWQGSRPPLA